LDHILRGTPLLVVAICRPDRFIALRWPLTASAIALAPDPDRQQTSGPILTCWGASAGRNIARPFLFVSRKFEKAEVERYRAYI
jgi:hypothetical protein